MSDESRELSGQYFYIDEGINSKQILSHLPNRKEIYPNVVDYSFNSDFIIALQKPDYKEFKSIIAFQLRDNLKKYPGNSKKDIFESEKVADSILKANSFYKKIFANKINFWIIDNKRKILFGPLSKQEYENKRIELNIPENIKLKEWRNYQRRAKCLQSQWRNRTGQPGMGEW